MGKHSRVPCWFSLLPFPSPPLPSSSPLSADSSHLTLPLFFPGLPSSSLFHHSPLSLLPTLHVLFFFLLFLLSPPLLPLSVLTPFPPSVPILPLIYLFSRVPSSPLSLPPSSSSIPSLSTIIFQLLAFSFLALLRVLHSLLFPSSLPKRHPHPLILSLTPLTPPPHRNTHSRIPNQSPSLSHVSSTHKCPLSRYEDDIMKIIRNKKKN